MYTFKGLHIHMHEKERQSMIDKNIWIDTYVKTDR